MTYWSDLVISTGNVKIKSLPFRPIIITFIYITIGSLCDQQISPFHGIWLICGISLAYITDWVRLTTLYPFLFSDLFSLSDCRILCYFGSFGLFDYLYWWAIVMCESDICQLRSIIELHYLHYLTVDSWTIWPVWSIWLLYQMGYLFVSLLSVQLQFYHLSTIINLIKLL